MDVATGAVATLFREVRVLQNESKCLQIPFCDAPNFQTRWFSIEICVVVLFLEFLASDTITSSRLLPKRLPRRRPLSGRLLPRRLLSRRFSRRNRWLPSSTIWFPDPWANAWWSGVRGGGLGESRERRRCQGCGRVLREKSGKTRVLEGHGVGGRGRVSAGIDGGWSVLEGLTGGDGASFGQRATFCSKGPSIEFFFGSG